MTINEPLLREIVADMRVDPKSWDQIYWIVDPSSTAEVGECGTIMCIAGKACALTAGVELLWQTSRFGTYKRWVDMVVLPSGRETSIFNAAQELLGLTKMQAKRIFHTVNYCEKCEKCVDDDHVYEEYHGFRKPTVEEFVNHITKITGIDFKDGENP